jgi:hypothetical protein
MAHRTDSTAQQQEEEEYFKIPKDFKAGYRALLVATQADWARGAVREIKCRLCPDAKSKKWGKFKRHGNWYGDTPAHDLLLRALRGLLHTQ